MNNSKLFSDEAANIYERAIGTLLKKNMLLYFAFADYEEVGCWFCRHQDNERRPDWSACVSPCFPHRVAWSTRRSTASITNSWPSKTLIPHWSTSSTWSLPGGRRASSPDAQSSRRPGRICARVTMCTWPQHWWSTTAARWEHTRSHDTCL